MKQDMEKQFIKQLEDLRIEYNGLEGGAERHKMKSTPPIKSTVFNTRSRAAVNRIAGANSPYGKQVSEIINEGQHPYDRAQLLFGVICALLRDVREGYLKSAEELVHAEVFSDFTEMAGYLLQERYKDAAAVIIGGVLEGHLRVLCRKHGIDTNVSTGSGIHPKKADTLNNELAKAGVYSKVDQTGVTAWLALRNKAAHGHYSEYSKEQVDLMLSGVREFMTRNPA